MVSCAVIEGTMRDVRIYVDGYELGPLPRCCHSCGGAHSASLCTSPSPGPPHCYLCGSREHGGRRVTACPLWKEASLLRRRAAHLSHFDAVHLLTPPATKDYLLTKLEITLGILDEEPEDPDPDMDVDLSAIPDAGLISALQGASTLHPQDLLDPFPPGRLQTRPPRILTGPRPRRG